jgi:chromosome segregation ATPase
MIAGRYMASGCSEQWCSWREGKTCGQPKPEDARVLAAEMREIADRAIRWERPETARSPIAAVRRQLTSKGRQVAELEAQFKILCDQNAVYHERGQAQINRLEQELVEVHHKGQGQIDNLEAQIRTLQEELEGLRQRRSLRAVIKKIAGG